MIKEPKGQVPWPLIIANSVILVLLAGTIFAWHNGLVESREKR